MTKKDYKLIAEVIREERDRGFKGQETTLQTLAEHLANKLAIDNPKFNREKFLAACFTP